VKKAAVRMLGTATVAGFRKPCSIAPKPHTWFSLSFGTFFTLSAKMAPFSD
jgi:hypothetical protein